MDGFSDNKGENLFVIAATNFKESIDEAIIRPGRIEIHIEINNLDKDARAYFLNRTIKHKPTSGKFDMNRLLMYTAGFTGAQLELLEKEASFYCLRNSIEKINQEILIDQINKIKYGEKLTYLSPEQMFEEIAIYEAGRAVVSKILMPHITIEYVSLTPKDHNQHFISHNYSDIQDNMTMKDFKDRICVNLAGRVSQIKKFGELDGLDTGAANDLQQATRDAYRAIAHYGMDKEVGYINLSGITDAKVEISMAKETKLYQEQIDTALMRWMGEGEKTTRELVEKNWDKILRLSELILEKEIIYEDELNKAIGVTNF